MILKNRRLIKRDLVKYLGISLGTICNIFGQQHLERFITMGVAWIYQHYPDRRNKEIKNGVA